MKRILIGFLLLCSCTDLTFAPNTDGADSQAKVGASSTAAAATKPNIVLIMADDLTFSDIQPYGSTQVKTPNLVRLANEGRCFDNMSTPTAMCGPARSSILTGLYPVRNGAWPNHSKVYDGTKSLGHYMTNLGYRSALIGKKHIYPDASFPFQFLDGRDSDDGTGVDLNLNLVDQFIREDSTKPFFVVVASNQPHVPWVRGDVSQYPAANVQVPAGYENTPLTRQNLAKYYAEITYLDSQVGRVLDILTSTGKASNTLVIFSTEQGSQFPFDKWTCYDRGLKNGFIARWPGVIPAGTRTNALVQTVDLAPTLVQIGGGTPSTINTGTPDANGDTGFDGKSFIGVLKGTVVDHRNFVFGVQTTRGIKNGSEHYAIRSVRNKDFLYISNLHPLSTFSSVATNTQMFQSWLEVNPNGRPKFYQTRPAEELYDLVNDPNQLNNLANNAQHTTVKQTLNAQLTAWMQQQGDAGKATEMAADGRIIAGGED